MKKLLLVLGLMSGYSVALNSDLPYGGYNDQVADIETLSPMSAKEIEGSGVLPWVTETLKGDLGIDNPLDYVVIPTKYEYLRISKEPYGDYYGEWIPVNRTEYPVVSNAKMHVLLLDPGNDINIKGSCDIPRWDWYAESEYEIPEINGNFNPKMISDSDPDFDDPILFRYGIQNDGSVCDLYNGRFALMWSYSEDRLRRDIAQITNKEREPFIRGDIILYLYNVLISDRHQLSDKMAAKVVNDKQLARQMTESQDVIN